MTPLKIILILLLLQTQNCFGQRINTDSLLNQFRNNVETELKNYNGIFELDDETMISYYTVILHSSIKDLIKYTNDSNPVVRSYIFSALMRNRQVKNNILLKILTIHQRDSAAFTTKGGDVYTSWTVTEFMQAGMQLRSENRLKYIDYKKKIEEIKREAASGFNLKINGLHHGLIEKDKLLQMDSLSLITNKIRIMSFTLLVAGKSFKSAGNLLTDEMKIEINKITSGDILLFYDIMAAVEDNITRRMLTTMSVKIK